MTNMTLITPDSVSVKKTATPEQLQNEFDYFQAQNFLKALLRKGMLSVDEFMQMTFLNREAFSPALAEIMQKTVDVNQIQR